MVKLKSKKMKHKLRIYIDTSVAGGYFDKEFARDSAIFFEQAKAGKFLLIVSNLLENEILDAPVPVRKLVASLTKAEKAIHNREAEELARKYIEANVVGKTSIEDCRHIALAVICKADILVSWNFRHIVNVERINGYNSVNLLFGYKVLDIRTPKEVLKYE